MREIVESAGERVCCLLTAQLVEDSQYLRFRIKRGLRAEAGKFGPQNELAKSGFSFRGELLFSHRVFYAEYALGGPPGRNQPRRLLFTLVEISYSPRG